MTDAASFVPSGYVSLWDAIDDACSYLAKKRGLLWIPDVRERRRFLQRNDGILAQVSDFDVILHRKVKQAVWERALAASELVEGDLDEWRSALGYVDEGSFAGLGSLIVDRSGAVILGQNAKNHPMAAKGLAMRQQAVDAGLLGRQTVPLTERQRGEVTQHDEEAAAFDAMIKLRDEVEAETRQLMWRGRTRGWRVCDGALEEISPDFWSTDEAWRAILGISENETINGASYSVLIKADSLLHAFEHGRPSGSRPSTNAERQARDYLSEMMKKPKVRCQTQPLLENDCNERFGIKGRTFKRAYCDAQALPETHESWRKTGPAKAETS
jgi:hypothetical protein